MSSSTTLPLHRIRFYDYTPSPITALAFPPTPLPSPNPADKGKQRQVDGDLEKVGSLVLARENGEVEVWEWVGGEDMGMGNWTLQRTLPPTLTHPSINLMTLVLRDPTSFYGRSSQIASLEEVRLYTSSSESSDLVERCLQTGKILSTYSIPAPPLWSMSVSPTHDLLVLATSAPTLSILSLTPQGLEPPPSNLLRSESLPSRTRTLSLAWGPPKPIESHGNFIWEDTYLVTGNSDSSFRKWQLPSASQPNGRLSIAGRSVVDKLSKSQKKNNRGTIIWGITVLTDHTIVTSDSLGTVSIWDGKSLAQKQSFGKCHKADAMVLIPGSGGKNIFTAGPDQRICQFTLINNIWRLTSSKSIHSHDIKTLSVYPTFNHYVDVTKNWAPVLASGGWDMGLVLTPCASMGMQGRQRNPLGRTNDKGSNRITFEDAYSRKMTYFNSSRGMSRISISRESRLVLGRNDRSVGIWRVYEDENGWEKVLEMDLKLRTNLIAQTISDDGKWVVISDLYETKLFRLITNDLGEIKAKRVKNFLNTLLEDEKLKHLNLENNGTGAVSLMFTPDSRRLIMGLAFSGEVVVLELDEEEGEVEVVISFKRELGKNGNGRIIKGRRQHKRDRKAAKLLNGHAHATRTELPNGTTHNHLVNGNTEMNGHDENIDEPVNEKVGGTEKANGIVHEKAEGERENEEEENESDDDEIKVDNNNNGNAVKGRIACMAISGDGQWLAVSDLGGVISVYNMDTLRPQTTLPTLPAAPVSITMPPSHPNILVILTPNQTIQFYHIEQRKFLSQTPQISALNRALRDQFLPSQSMVFEPASSRGLIDSKNVKLVIWSNDWICSVKLDFDLISKTMRGKNHDKNDKSLEKSLRRKRAKEAKEQLERVISSPASTPSTTNFDGHLGSPNTTIGSSLSRQISNDSGSTNANTKGPGGGENSSSADDSEFYKFIHDKFRSIVTVDWFDQGEMLVIERPIGDYMSDLPAPFWSGGFGRS